MSSYCPLPGRKEKYIIRASILKVEDASIIYCISSIGAINAGWIIDRLGPKRQTARRVPGNFRADKV